MKFASLLLLASVVAFFPGCGHVDLTPEGDPNRTLAGTVNVRMDLIPPSDAEVVVRLVEPPDTQRGAAAASGDMVIGERGATSAPERVVAEQVIRAPAAMPVNFQFDYRASDAQLQRGLNLDARISWGGRVRFRAIESHVVTLGTATVRHDLWLEPVR